jgi:uncharacterized protein YlaI
MTKKKGASKHTVHPKYTPICEECHRKITAHRVGVYLLESRLYWRKGMTVCRECQEKLDAPRIEPKDLDYRAAVVKHVMGGR